MANRRQRFKKEVPLPDPRLVELPLPPLIASVAAPDRNVASAAAAAGADITNLRAEIRSKKKSNVAAAGGSSKLRRGHPRSGDERRSHWKTSNVTLEEEPLSAFDLSKDSEDLIASEGFHGDLSELLYSVPDLPPSLLEHSPLKICRSNPPSAVFTGIGKDSTGGGCSDCHHVSSGCSESLFCEKQGELVLSSEWIQRNDKDDGLLQAGFIDLPAWPLFDQSGDTPSLGCLDSAPNRQDYTSIPSKHLLLEYQNGFLEARIEEQQSTMFSEESFRTELPLDFPDPTCSSPYESAKITAARQRQDLQKPKLVMSSVKDPVPRDSRRTSVNAGRTSETVKLKAYGYEEEEEEEEDIDTLFNDMFSAAPLLAEEEDASVYLQQECCTHLSHAAARIKYDHGNAPSSSSSVNCLPQIAASIQLSCINSSNPVCSLMKSPGIATTRGDVLFNDMFSAAPLLAEEEEEDASVYLQQECTRLSHIAAQVESDHGNVPSSSVNCLPKVVAPLRLSCKNSSNSVHSLKSLSIASTGGDVLFNDMFSAVPLLAEEEDNASKCLQQECTCLSHIAAQIEPDHGNDAPSSSVNCLPQITASIQLSCKSSSESVCSLMKSPGIATTRGDVLFNDMFSAPPLLAEEENTPVGLQQECTCLSHIAAKVELDRGNAPPSSVNCLLQVGAPLRLSCKNSSDSVHSLKSLVIATMRGDVLFSDMFSATPFLAEEEDNASVYTRLSHIAVRIESDHGNVSSSSVNCLPQIAASIQLSGKNSSDSVHSLMKSLGIATMRGDLLAEEEDNASVYLQQECTRFSHIAAQIKSDHGNAPSSSSVNCFPQINALLQLSCKGSPDSVHKSLGIVTRRGDLLAEEDNASVHLQRECTHFSHTAARIESDHGDAPSSSLVNCFPQIVASSQLSCKSSPDSLHSLKSLGIATMRGGRPASLDSERKSTAGSKKPCSDDNNNNTLLLQKSRRGAASCSLQLSLVSSSGRRKYNNNNNNDNNDNNNNNNRKESQESSMVVRTQLGRQSQSSHRLDLIGGGEFIFTVLKLCKSPLWVVDESSPNLNRICNISSSACDFNEASKQGVVGAKEDSSSSSSVIAKKDSISISISLALISCEKKELAWHLE